jgi:hypothetical protein
MAAPKVIGKRPDMSIEEIGSVENESTLGRFWRDGERYLGFSPPLGPRRGDHIRVATLYFISSPPFLKIGITDNIARRLKEFQAGNPHLIHLAGHRTIPAPLARQIERRVHEHFAERAIGREWFRDLDHREAAQAADPHIRKARTAIQRWVADGYFP